MRMPFLFESPEVCAIAGSFLSLGAVGLHLIAVLSLSFVANLFLQAASHNR